MRVRLYRLPSGRRIFYWIPRSLFTDCGFTVKWLGLIATHRYAVHKRRTINERH